MYSYYAPAIGYESTSFYYHFFSYFLFNGACKLISERSHFPEHKLPHQNYFGKSRRSFQPKTGPNASKFDYKTTIETPILPSTVHGAQFESRFRNKGHGAFLDTTDRGHIGVFKAKDGAGPGAYDQKNLDLVVLNDRSGYTIGNAERFNQSSSVDRRDPEVPGPAAYNLNERREKGLTSGTGMDRNAVAVTVPKASRNRTIPLGASGPGPKYFPTAPKMSGLAGTFATERLPKNVPGKEELPQMEGIFGLGCSVEEHILYGQCLDGRCSERAVWEVASNPVDKAKSKKKWTGNLLKPGLLFAARDGKPELIRHFLAGFQDPVDKTWSEPPDIDMRDNEGRTPLHLACQHGQLEAVNTLLTIPKTLTTRPANADVQDKRGRTALHYAAEGGNYEIVKELLFQGADPGLLDKNGMAAEDLCNDRKHRVYQLLKLASLVDSTQRRNADVVYRKQNERDVYSQLWKEHVRLIF